MKLKRLILVVGVVLIILVGYFLYQMNKFSQGVIEDSKRMENIELPKEVELTDSTKMILGKDSIN